MLRSVKIVQLPVDRIVSNPFQARRSFDGHSLKPLAVSIQHYGLIHPIVVHPVKDRGSYGNQRYEVVCGERRFRAVRMLGLRNIPARVVHATDKEMLHLMLLENLHREDLTPLEEGTAFVRLLSEFEQETIDDLSSKIGVEREEISEKVTLLDCHPVVRRALEKGMITAAHAKFLQYLEDRQDMLEAVYQTVRKNLSESALKKLVYKMLKKKGKSLPQSADRKVTKLDVQKVLLDPAHAHTAVQEPKMLPRVLQRLQRKTQNPDIPSSWPVFRRLFIRKVNTVSLFLSATIKFAAVMAAILTLLYFSYSGFTRAARYFNENHSVYEEKDGGKTLDLFITDLKPKNNGN